MQFSRHMMEYYELSTTKCQSAQQQAFNNEMVIVVQEVCERQGWKFADCFDSKGLRDRIRYVSGMAVLTKGCTKEGH